MPNLTINMQNLTINAQNLTNDFGLQREYVVTYNDMLQSLSNQLSDRMFFLSVVFLGYVLLNMYVFKDGARFRAYFDRLYDADYHIFGNPLGAWIFFIVQSLALAGAIMLVMLNIIYRMELNI